MPPIITRSRALLCRRPAPSIGNVQPSTSPALPFRWQQQNTNTNSPSNLKCQPNPNLDKMAHIEPIILAILMRIYALFGVLVTGLRMRLPICFFFMYTFHIFPVLKIRAVKLKTSIFVMILYYIACWWWWKKIISLPFTWYAFWGWERWGGWAVPVRLWWEDGQTGRWWETLRNGYNEYLCIL